MPKKHSTSNEAGHFNLSINDDGTWSIDQIQAAILADIRRRQDRQLVTQGETLQVLRDIRTVMRRIDKRLAKRIKLR